MAVRAPSECFADAAEDFDMLLDTTRFVFVGPPVPVTAREHTPPQSTTGTLRRAYEYDLDRFCGSSCAGNGKGAPHNTSRLLTILYYSSLFSPT
eukprot:7948793-Pyramimonas_sp.AAC.2